MCGLLDHQSADDLRNGVDGKNPVDLDDVDLMAINPLPPYVWYQDMADFAEGLSDERANRRAVQWLADNGLVDRDTADLFVAEHPDPAPALSKIRFTYRNTKGGADDVNRPPRTAGSYWDKAPSRRR
ncbi:hypothetical protein [Amycolatopsis xylanica]|uniref:hypothetical protein n=1 Tax=Amycolatopsis xylanica TaxID=589385 RepID=UPI001FE20BCA|nr:hypothetical protein [Amycolatopsis xylanica]